MDFQPVVRPATAPTVSPPTASPAAAIAAAPAAAPTAARYIVPEDAAAAPAAAPAAARHGRESFHTRCSFTSGAGRSSIAPRQAATEHQIRVFGRFRPLEFGADSAGWALNQNTLQVLDRAGGAAFECALDAVRHMRKVP